MKSIPYLVFRAGEGRLGIPIDRVHGATRAKQIVPLPGAPSGYVGVTFVRGEPVGVLDAATIFLGVPARSAETRRPDSGFLLLMDGERHALLVDKIDAIEEIEDLSSVSAPSAVEAMIRLVPAGQSVVLMGPNPDVSGGRSS